MKQKWIVDQEVCSFNVKFAEEAAEPGYAARGPGERPVGVEALLVEGDSASTGATSADSAESRGSGLSASLPQGSAGATCS